jgi:hypothetical protein
MLFVVQKDQGFGRHVGTPLSEPNMRTRQD